MINISTDPWIICLGGSNSHVPIVKASRRLGYKVLVVDINPLAPAFQYSDDCLVHSTHDYESLVRELPERPFTSVLCRSTGFPLFTAAKLNKSLSLKGINQVVADISTSKSSMRLFSEKNGISTPKGTKLRENENPSEEWFKKKVVVKPDFTLVGKAGISLVDGNSSADLSSAVQLAKSESGNGIAEVQEYVDGIDCSFLFWVDDRRGDLLYNWDEVTDFGDDGLSFKGLIGPSVINGLELKSQILRTSDKVFSNLRDFRGPLALSYRISESKAETLIEVHADFTGDAILDVLAPASTGIDYLELLTEMAITGDSSKVTRIQEALRGAKPTWMGGTGSRTEIRSGLTYCELLRDKLADPNFSSGYGRFVTDG